MCKLMLMLQIVNFYLW